MSSSKKTVNEFQEITIDSQLRALSKIRQELVLLGITRSELDSLMKLENWISIGEKWVLNTPCNRNIRIFNFDRPGKVCIEMKRSGMDLSTYADYRYFAINSEADLILETLTNAFIRHRNLKNIYLTLNKLDKGELKDREEILNSVDDTTRRIIESYEGEERGAWFSTAKLILKNIWDSKVGK